MESQEFRSGNRDRVPQQLWAGSLPSALPECSLQKMAVAKVLTVVLRRGRGRQCEAHLANIVKAAFNSLTFISVSCFDLLLPDARGKEECNWTHVNRSTDDT